MQATETVISDGVLSKCLLSPGQHEYQTRVLLIEDNEDAMSLVKFALMKFGEGQYSLIWAKTLGQGIKEAAAEEADVVLLDLGLPECRGQASYARVHEQAPNIPVVVLTSDETKETKEAVIEGGASKYLLKRDISGPSLVRAIEAAILNARKTRDTETVAGNETRRMLLIEDDEDAMLLVSYALQEYGKGRFSLEWEPSLQRGMERLAKRDIDAVILDLGLPDSMGSSGYMELRKAYPNVPIVVLTGSEPTGLEFMLLACGADAYLEKSFTSGSRLVRAVDSAFEKPGASRQSGARIQ